MSNARVSPLFWWRRKPLVAVVRLEGIIATGSASALNLANAGRALQAAFRMRRAREVAIVVNSPGGAPVQAARLHDQIRWLAAHHDRKVTAFVEDIAASGGYWLALAADEIVAHPSSIVGSIGVITATFGFDRALERLGVDRRLYATGAHKGMLDPFRAENADDVRILEGLHADTYAQFVDLVRQRRGERLQDTPELFDGRVFSGTKALAHGLVDACADPTAFLRERYGDDVRFRVFAPRPRPWWRRLRGETAASELLSTFEERMLWARYGL